MNKYHNIKVTLDGYSFDSKKECSRYQDLLFLQKAGIISELKVHPKFTLLESYKDKENKTERAITYEADFSYFDNEKKINVVEDVKSEPTSKDKVFIIKRKMFKKLYPEYKFTIIL